MRRTILRERWQASLLAVILGTLTIAAAQAPTIPVGLDAYRQWDRLPYQSIGERAYMRSTYDRAGGNEGADASHFLYQVSDSFNVTVDIRGKGILYFARFNQWHGSPWHFETDGTDHIVKESASDNPGVGISPSTFIPQTVFPSPLTCTWSNSRGADLTWVPVPFDSSFRMAYTRTCFGTGYYIYRLYADTSLLSQPIRTFDFATAPDTAVLNLINRSGTDIAPQPHTHLGDSLGVTELTGAVSLAAHDSVVMAQVSNGPATVRALTISAPKGQSVAFGRIVIRMTWDHRTHPSVETPLNLFFGTGSFYNRNNKAVLVKAFPVSVQFDSVAINVACYFPMPYFQTAKIELINRDTGSYTPITWKLRTQPYTGVPNQSSYFHATYVDHGIPTTGQDLVFLDTRNVEGGGDWSGKFVGTTFIFTTAADLSTCEGDPRFFFDDSKTPQAYGTGTEEWGGGGDYWENGAISSLPFAGHPVGTGNTASTIPEDMINSAYRFLIGDCMPFGKNARIQLEHGGNDETNDHYSSVTYWYGLPAASLVQTDSINIGNTASEQAHFYNSPDATVPYALTTAYDALGPVVTNSTDTGRTTTGTSTFSMSISPTNLGILLRRKLDYSYPNQTARVFVSGDTVAGWKSAGMWYLAGSNTCVYSNPTAELGATVHTVETSSRKFREDEFVVPAGLTKGLSQAWIRIQTVQDSTPLYPGHPFPQQSKWSEMQYKAYSYTMPGFTFVPAQAGVYTAALVPSPLTLRVCRMQSNAMATLEFGIPGYHSGTDRSATPVSLCVFNVKGQPVATILKTMLAPGLHWAPWNTATLPAGTYVVVLKAGMQSAVSRVSLMK